ncbi:MAG: hypothetical protein AB7F75_02390 [Planctomycetota bacterium]
MGSFPYTRSKLLMFTGLLLGGVTALTGTDGKQDSEEELKKTVERLEKRLEAVEKGAASIEVSSDRWTQGLGKGDIASVGNLRWIDVSLDIMGVAGVSSQKGSTLRQLQGGGHDPKRRGFTLQQAELGLSGMVDPFFRAEAYLTTTIDEDGETQVELEEASATTTNLPWGLEVEAGHFFTEFGRHNPSHAHSWSFLDQPVVLTRFFGPDGMRGVGARVGWLMPLPWWSQVHGGVQNAKGENMESFLANSEVFEERPVAGRTRVAGDGAGHDGDLVNLVRWENGVDLGSEWSAKFGISRLEGPNATGRDASTLIEGVDLVMQWLPENNEKGWPFVQIQSEALRREYVAAVDLTNELPREKFKDGGWYTQALWGFTPGWATGLRWEKTDRGSHNIHPNLHESAWRSARERISPMLAWHPSEFTRLRLQYNYDRAEYLEPDHDVHSLWFGLEIKLGSHQHQHDARCRH